MQHLKSTTLLISAEDETVSVTGTSTGVEEGQSVYVLLSDGTTDVEVTATVGSDGTWTATDANISELTNGEITITADVSDAAGNAATQATKTITLDNVSPSAFAIDATLEVDNIVNSAEDETVSVTGTSTGVEEGQSVYVLLSDGTTDVEVTATVGSDGTWTATDANISELTNGEITITADVSDAAGNAATQATKTITLDNVSPSAFAIDATLEVDNIVSSAEDETVSVTGTSTGVEEGQSVYVLLSDGTTDVEVTATVGSDGTWTATDANISELTNGEITITADVSDAAGNAATQATKTITLDNVSPSAFAIDATLEVDNIVSSAEDETVSVTGTSTGVEEGQSVYVLLSDGTTDVEVTATVGSDGTWTATDANISELTNGEITITADVSDAAGNAATQATKTITLDNVSPSAFAIDATLEVDNIVNSAEDETVSVTGTSTGVEEGQSVSVRLSDGTTDVEVTATVGSDGTWTATDANISELTNGEITITADVSDAAGNAATQATKTITLDNVSPSAFAIDATLEVDNIVSSAEDETVSVTGTSTGVEEGQSVYVLLSHGTTDVEVTATVGSDGTWTATDANISELTNGEITITADVSDAAGNAATQVTKTITIDNVSPVVPLQSNATLEVDNMVNSAEDETVSVTGTSTGVEEGQLSYR